MESEQAYKPKKLQPQQITGITRKLQVQQSSRPKKRVKLTKCDMANNMDIKTWEYGPFVTDSNEIDHYIIVILQDLAPLFIGDYNNDNIVTKIMKNDQTKCIKSVKLISTAESQQSLEKVIFEFYNGNINRSIDGNTDGNTDGTDGDTNITESDTTKITVTIRKPVFTMGPFFSYRKISRRCIECLRELQQFYENNENVVNLIVPIVNRTFDVSKRALEFCCVTKAKRDNVVYKYSINDMPIIVDVHKQYNQCLKMWKRECFDFFQRYNRIYLSYTLEDQTNLTNKKLVETTTGQVHGIYWAHTYGVIVYARKNLDTIMQDMSLTHGRNRKDIKKFKSRGMRRPRKPLVQGSSTGTALFPVDITVYFNNETDDYEEYASSDAEEYEEHEEIE